MLKRKTTVEYHSQDFDFISHVLYSIVNCYLKCLSPFAEIWCLKKNALGFIWIHFRTIFNVLFFHCFKACLCTYFELLEIMMCATEQELNIVGVNGCTCCNFWHWSYFMIIIDTDVKENWNKYWSMINNEQNIVFS